MKGGLLMNNYYISDMDDRKQEHTHEILGSTMIAGSQPHNHRFAEVSSEAIPVTGGHVHEISTNTDFDVNHYHQIKLRTGLPILVGNNRHIHPLIGTTSNEMGHNHNFQTTSLM
jgi:hypothetical protein